MSHHIINELSDVPIDMIYLRIRYVVVLVSHSVVVLEKNGSKSGAVWSFEAATALDLSYV